MRHRRAQRGEGKVGCIISLLVLVIIGAAAFQIVPVMFSNNDFLSSTEDLAGRAATIPLPTLEAQISQKAKDLGIQEALAPGAIVITKSGDGGGGVCTVRIHYTRKIDFYGVFTYPLETSKTMTIPYADYR